MMTFVELVRKFDGTADRSPRPMDDLRIRSLYHLLCWKRASDHSTLAMLVDD